MHEHEGWVSHVGFFSIWNRNFDMKKKTLTEIVLTVFFSLLFEIIKLMTQKDLT